LHDAVVTTPLVYPVAIIDRLCFHLWFTWMFSAQNAKHQFSDMQFQSITQTQYIQYRLCTQENLVAIGNRIFPLAPS